jgi:uncharacterized membrane protein YiaA
MELSEKLKQEAKKEFLEEIDKMPLMRVLIAVNIFSWLIVVSSVIVLIWGTWQDALKLGASGFVIALVSGIAYRTVKNISIKSFEETWQAYDSK